jgi:hypothetical protein
MKLLNAAALVFGGFLPLASVPVAAATMTFDWTLTGPAASLGGFHFTGSGTITVTTGTSSDLVTQITGTVTDGFVTDPITGLAPPGTLNGNDNLLFPIGTMFSGPPISTSPYASVSNLDTHGVAFTVAAGTIDVFGFFAPNTMPAPNPSNNNYGEFSPDGFGVGHFTVTPVPAPIAGAGLPSLILACCGLLGCWRRRRKTS